MIFKIECCIILLIMLPFAGLFYVLEWLENLAQYRYKIAESNPKYYIQDMWRSIIE